MISLKSRGFSRVLSHHNSKADISGLPWWLSGKESACQCRRPEFEQTLGDGEGQGSLACCSPWVCKESDRTEQLNSNSCWQVTSLPLNKMSKFFIAFLPRSKCLLISLLQSPSAVILEPKKIHSLTVSTSSSCNCHEVMALIKTEHLT